MAQTDCTHSTLSVRCIQHKSNYRSIGIDYSMQVFSKAVIEGVNKSNLVRVKAVQRDRASASVSLQSKQL